MIRTVLPLLLVGAIVLFFWRLGDRDLWSSHEARAAMDAQSLLAPDSTGFPRLFDGRLDVQKPPLYYWIVAGLARLRGTDVDAVAVRLPAALSALGTVLVVVVLGTLVSGQALPGLLAGLVLATGIHFPWLARIGRIDGPLTLTTTLAGAAFVLALTRTEHRILRWPLLLAGYLACAGGILLKGPIGIVLPGAIVAGWLLAEGRWPACWELTGWRRLLHEIGAWWGVPVVLAITLPWFLWADHVSGGQFSREFFWLHNVQRGLGGARLRAHPWWLYGPYLLLYLLPWSPLLLAGLFPRWRKDCLARLGLAWLLAVVILLSASRFKRADYLLPAYPGAALFLGCLLARAWAHRSARLACVATVILMLLGWAVHIGVVLVHDEPYRDQRPFASLVRRHAPAPVEIAFFRTEAHTLAFHVGRPLAVVVEWPQLQARLNRPGTHYLVMPAPLVAEGRHHLPAIELEEISRNSTLSGGGHERPLVLLRARAVSR